MPISNQTVSVRATPDNSAPPPATGGKQQAWVATSPLGGVFSFQELAGGCGAGNPNRARYRDYVLADHRPEHQPSRFRGIFAPVSARALCQGWRASACRRDLSRANLSRWLRDRRRARPNRLSSGSSGTASMVRVGSTRVVKSARSAAASTRSSAGQQNLSALPGESPPAADRK